MRAGSLRLGSVPLELRVREVGFLGLGLLGLGLGLLGLGLGLGLFLGSVPLELRVREVGDMGEM